MTWVPIFYVSSQDFDGDIKSLKTVFSQFEKQIHQKDGFGLVQKLNLQWDGGFTQFTSKLVLSKN